MSRTRHQGPPWNAGFTLIELMIVVVVIGILAAIAVPLYADSVTRGKIIEATTKLGNFRTDMEKWFMDNRTYFGPLGANGCGIPDIPAGASENFDIRCIRGAGPPETYVVTATGANSMSPLFVYTVNQANAKTSAGPAGKYTNGACWAVRKDGSC
jgi:type IV pilus assembly protein PilE